MRRISVFILIAVGVSLAAGQSALAQSKEPIKIGLAAAVSGGSAASGEAIKRGIQIAMDEINAKGGLLGGRKLELVIRDDEGNPAKGVTIARELVEREKAVVIFGGLHTTVALAQVPVWQELNNEPGELRQRPGHERNVLLRHPVCKAVEQERMKSRIGEGNLHLACCSRVHGERCLKVPLYFTERLYHDCGFCIKGFRFGNRDVSSF